MREKRKKKLTRVFQTKPNQKKQQPKRGYGRALLECCETVARACSSAPPTTRSRERRGPRWASRARPRTSCGTSLGSSRATCCTWTTRCRCTRGCLRPRRSDRWCCGTGRWCRGCISSPLRERRRRRRRQRWRRRRQQRRRRAPPRTARGRSRRPSLLPASMPSRARRGMTKLLSLLPGARQSGPGSRTTPTTVEEAGAEQRRRRRQRCRLRLRGERRRDRERFLTKKKKGRRSALRSLHTLSPCRSCPLLLPLACLY